MTEYILRVPTFAKNSWTGSNTEDFKTWVTPYLLNPPSPEESWTWEVVDDHNDPENTIVDGILSARVVGQSMSPYNLLFVKDYAVVAGPMLNGQPARFLGFQVLCMSPTEFDGTYEPKA